MRALANKKILALLALVAAAAGLAGAQSTGSRAATPTLPLCAAASTLTTGGSGPIPIWGFGSTCGTVSLPGPVLEVNVGDVVTINLTTDPSLAGHDVSFELAGLPVKKTGATTYEFTASRPGTFAYQSPGDAGRQGAMGLYGALVVRPAGETPRFTASSCSSVAGSAYGSSYPGTAYNGECVLVLSAIDPLFNAAPDTFNLNDYLATYWLINGTAYPGTGPLTGGSGARNLLLRYVNGGFDNTSLSLLGVHERVLARDAWPLNNPFDAAAEIVPAGGTEDAIVTVPASGAPSANGFALFNRNLHVTNGTACVTTNPCVPNANHQPGGMLTFIQP